MPQIKYGFPAVAGVLVSLVAWKIMSLDVRHAVAIVVGIVFLSIVMMKASNINDILIYSIVFHTPFSLFGKIFFKQEIVYATVIGINLGLVEVIILMAYGVWFAQIFISKTEPLPKLNKIDYFIALLFFSQFISMIGAPNKLLVLFDIIFNIKHVLIYFFIAHKTRREHLKWIVIILLFAILIEGSLAMYQKSTGQVGLGRSKGNVEDAGFMSQNIVPGIEKVSRAEGTLAEAHQLGLYFAMLLPVPYVLLMMRLLRPLYRLMLALILIIGSIGLILTFARSGWFSFAIAAACATGIIVFRWKQVKTVLILVLILLALMPAGLFFQNTLEDAYTKLFESPSELLTERYYLIQSAMDIWSHDFLFGYGPGNFMIAIEEPYVRSSYDTGQIVHNAYLYLAAELGLFGLIAFYSIIFIAIIRCWKVLRCEDLLIRGLGLAILTGLFGYLLDGITGPFFRHVVIYSQLWIYIGLIVSFKSMLDEKIINQAVSAK